MLRSNADPKVTLALLEAQLAKHEPGAAEVKKAQKAADYLKGMLKDFRRYLVPWSAGMNGCLYGKRPQPFLPL